MIAQMLMDRMPRVAWLWLAMIKPRMKEICGEETNAFCMSRSGRVMPVAKMAPLDLAVPYADPITVKTMAAAQPMAPKND